jgi:enamine deaminase RidA (YjgF/YER057c/UK114 family)
LHKHPVYSQVSKVSGEKTLVFVAGQVDRGLEYEMRSDSCQHSDWRGQYIGTMENVGRGLTAAGATWDDVVFIRKFVTDMGAYLAMTGSPGSNLPEYFKDWEAPPSTLIQVVALSEPCQLLEIDVMAVIPSS